MIADVRSALASDSSGNGSPVSVAEQSVLLTEK